ncbi:unnamed protein product [Phaedon cochleariae]|uniref:Mitochondrial 28S ribosomal protein S27 n=1 Tax=Phaedon cochleariae TaxID=80249 RepID=A0A9N9SEH0_PHACE|nr:unnamed protein product [Phaedon cochleariae]
MYKLLKKIASQRQILGRYSNINFNVNVRTFLSQAYYCQEVWDRRLNSPILQKVNLDDLYYELESRFLKTRQVSAVEVDIFANAVTDDTFVDELLDILYKLRLTADTGNTLNSTSHAVVRALLRCGKKDDLLNTLDDRLNYGLFLDYYTANLLMDSFYKSSDYASGARVASQLMLQEEYEHPITHSFALLHCYNYLLKPEGWPIPTPPEEPEEEVKVRVKFLRNPFDDDHFDLRDPKKIVGKTLAMFNKAKNDPLSNSFSILGWALFGKLDKVEEFVTSCKKDNIVLYKEIIDLIPDDESIKNIVSEIKTQSMDISKHLISELEKVVQTQSERDIAEQCEVFSKWESQRVQALEDQKEKLSRAKRLETLENLKKSMQEKETKLWFFENEEKIELEIEAGLEKMVAPKTKKKVVKEEQNYVPPEVWSKQRNPNNWA